MEQQPHCICEHSHKKRKDSLEARAVLIEISVLCWNLPSGPKHWGSVRKNIVFPKGNKLFAGDLRANLDETNAGMVQFTKRGTGNGLPNIKDTFAESLQQQMSVLHESMCIFKAGLSDVHVIAGQNIKKKCLICQILIKILIQYAISNSSLHNLKIYSLKGCIETSQRWICV